ncbi:MAG TPA: cation:dicarboxylase symporter family transporter [Xanthomonadales bacterium]
MLKRTISGWMRLSLSARILIGLGLGIFAGLFFGEASAILQPLADIYIRLMQMTVLPYLITSLVIAFGQLEAQEAKRLALRGGLLLLMIWVVTSMVLVVLPMTFPDYNSASFFSHSLVEPQQSFSMTELYFTSNPFASLSQNVVPAVVLFSCLIGIGLIGLDDKERLLAPLRTWNKAIVRITGFVINLTPYGVFAIGAVTAGTMQPDMIGRLEVYFIAFSIGALLLAFWILPLLVTAVTPFRYREVSGIARDALLTAFVANSAFIVLPILVERSKKLLEQHGLLDENANSATEVLIPVMFNFPNAGKLLTLLFIPFAAWISGAALEGNDYATLLSTGIPSYFAKAQVALPFLLDVFGLPQDVFQLYIPTTIITGKFDSLLTAMNLLVFALLGAGALGGFLVFKRGRLLRAAAGILGGTALVVIILRVVFALMIDTSYHMDEAVRHMQVAKRAVETIVHHEMPDMPTVARSPGIDSLTHIRERGILKIGYDPDNLPMSFFNTNEDLVGFEVELAEKLATSLKLRAEFVPIEWSILPQMLASGVIDVMPGMWYRPYWFSSVQLTDPYFLATVGLAVRDERRDEFDSMEKLNKAKGLKIGVPLDTTQIEYSMQRYFGKAGAEFVTIEFWQSYFEGKHPEIDAFLMPAEHAAAWTLLHPQFTVVVPQPDPVRVPTAFGVALESDDLAKVINEWVIYAANAGIVDEAYDYWVMGQGTETTVPRWSILRNVLGWVD